MAVLADGPVRRLAVRRGWVRDVLRLHRRENNQWDPALYDGTTPVEPPATPEEGYHLTEDLTDRAVGWIRQQKALMPDKPFFVYFAPGATHAPHHVPKEWIDKYAGRFDDGWDAQRSAPSPARRSSGSSPPTPS